MWKQREERSKGQQTGQEKGSLAREVAVATQRGSDIWKVKLAKLIEKSDLRCHLPRKGRPEEGIF